MSVGRTNHQGDDREGDGGNGHAPKSRSPKSPANKPPTGTPPTDKPSADKSSPKKTLVPSGVHHFKMTIRSDPADGRKAKDRILEAITASGFNPDSAFAVRLAVEEAIQNAIKHGNKHDPEKKVVIEAKVTSKQAEIIIEDEGVGFQRDGVPDPRHEENLEKCSGRGIFLIESYMNRVEWSQGGRRLRMVRRNQENGPHPQ